MRQICGSEYRGGACKLIVYYLRRLISQASTRLDK